jgi:AmmeMemoRadiSam system protein B
MSDASVLGPRFFMGEGVREMSVHAPPLPVRPAAVAGAFYPGAAAALKRAVLTYLDEAQPPDVVPRAVIAPHAGYIYSGPVAAYAFKALETVQRRTWTVYLMGPAHFVPIAGVALGRFRAFQTPLGDVPVATERVAAMLQNSRLYEEAAVAHAPEHSLEVELPFLQLTLGDFRIVPMLFGDVNPAEVAQDLGGRLDEDSLIVVSSDLSHYYDYETARRLDQRLLADLLAGDIAAVARGQACGLLPILTLMHLAQSRGWRPVLLDYRNSGDTAGDKHRVVGYASVAYI